MLTFSCHAAEREIVRESVPIDSCNTIENPHSLGMVNSPHTSRHEGDITHLKQMLAVLQDLVVLPLATTHPVSLRPEFLRKAVASTLPIMSSLCVCARRFYGSKLDDRSWVICGAGTLAYLEGVCLHARQESTRHTKAMHDKALKQAVQHCTGTSSKTATGSYDQLGTKALP